MKFPAFSTLMAENIPDHLRDVTKMYEVIFCQLQTQKRANVSLLEA